MTSPAPHHRVVALFNGLLRRAKEGKNCLSLQSMALAYDFNSPEQVQSALDRLVQSGHIRVDIGGKYPALRIVKDHYKALHECRAKVLSPAKIEAGQVRAVPAPDPVAAETTLGRKISPNAPEMPTAFEVVGKIETHLTLTKPASDTPKQVNFRVSASDYEWLQEQLEKTSEPMSMSGLVKDIMEVEIMRRRAEGGKFRVSAAAVTAARDAGQPLDQFITNLIELGLRARQAEGARL